MLKKLAELLQAQLEEMTRGTFEIMAKAPDGYVWIDNGQPEMYEEQFEYEERSDVKKNLAERMQKGLSKA